MANFPVLSFESALLKKTKLSPNTLEFSFEVPEDFAFIAGQFVMLESEGSEGKLIKRAFSIASAPSQKNSIDLCIKVLPDGRLSKPLSELPLQATVKLQGPYGKFFLQEEHSKNLLFIAAGTGIAPLRSMILALFDKGVTLPITLVFGFHAPSDFLYQGELEQLAKDHNNFTLVPICSTPDDNWKGLTGYVQDVLQEQFSDGTDYDAYLCGPPKMVSQTVALLSKQHFKRIFREAWG